MQDVQAARMQGGIEQKAALTEPAMTQERWAKLSPEQQLEYHKRRSIVCIGMQTRRLVDP